MADDSWAPQHALTEVNAPESPRLPNSLFQVLRRIECEHRAFPRLGEAHEPALEAVRLGQDTSLGFEGSAITSDRSREGAPPRIGVSFFGLFGPNGPMPLHLSEYVQQRSQSHRDATLARFADIFHHRLLTLFYRAWANAQPVVSRDRPDDDAIARYVAALLGQATLGSSGSDADRAQLYMARHLVGQTRHPEGLIKILGEHFGTTVQIEEFVGEWLKIPDEYCWRLSNVTPGSTKSMGHLGTSTRVGTETWERQFKFRIVLGPMQRETYDRFLPRGDFMPTLVKLVQRYIGYELSWDVRLLLSKPDAVPTTLGVSGRLGQTSYLGNLSSAGSPSRDAVVLNPLAQAG
ncbi:MAG: hypothetical protein RLZZ450_1286 [Pseudomonadota bacterium]|jgi:type VI secretion system protein ImpH